MLSHVAPNDARSLLSCIARVRARIREGRREAVRVQVHWRQGAAEAARGQTRSLPRADGRNRDAAPLSPRTDPLLSLSPHEEILECDVGGFCEKSLK